MTTLGCNVNSCCHNKDNCCCLSSIDVKGKSACTCDDTCCGSYFEAGKEGATKNSSETPKITLAISCDACNCIYNEDKVCHADHIDISGICATDAGETVCATFKCE